MSGKLINRQPMYSRAYVQRLCRALCYSTQAAQCNRIALPFKIAQPKLRQKHRTCLRTITARRTFGILFAKRFDSGSAAVASELCRLIAAQPARAAMPNLALGPSQTIPSLRRYPTQHLARRKPIRPCGTARLSTWPVANHSVLAALRDLALTRNKPIRPRGAARLSTCPSQTIPSLRRYAT